MGLEGIAESLDMPVPDAATEGRPGEGILPQGARGPGCGREPAWGEKGYSAGRRERTRGSEGPGGSRQRPRGRRPPEEIGDIGAPGDLNPAEPAADDRAGDEGTVDIPAWVEPEAAALSPRLLAKGRAELLPAGAGVSLGPEEPAEAPRAKEPVFKRILIDASDSEEVRIAVLEDGRLEELYYERPDEKKYLGNIYKGRVVNLEPAIQAAFVDLGIGRNGFLHVSDVLPAYKDTSGIPLDNLSMRFADRRRLKIQDILQRGQEVLVQISKDAIGAKGPSLTTYVSVPGKYLVLMPGVNRHGVSKRIQDTEERAKLRENLVQLDLPKGVGYIVRTAGQDRPRADLEKDFQYLMRIWEEIRSKVRESSTPALLYEETDLVIRTLRDLFGPDVDEILMDSAGVYERAKSFLAEVMPQAGGRIKHYTGSTPLFYRFGVEEEIEKIYNRRVPLPSGGYIVLEQTEALVAIDVNSGKYRDEEDLEATAVKTNLEAAQEIARQLRLRDLGGVIVNDFIDMESEVNRRAVERALRAALKRDRAKSWISRISRFGIIEMTRQRVRPSFERSNHEPCKHCRGTGVVKSARSLGIAILRQVRFTLAQKRREVCEVVAHASVVEYLLNDRRADLTTLESSFKKTVLVKVEPTFSPEQYVIRSR